MENSQELSGWEYYSYVYANPELRKKVINNEMNAPSVSEQLQSENLCRGEVYVGNVPRLPPTQVAIRLLIREAVGRNVAILDIHMTLCHWRIRFYRESDAREVQHALRGYIFQGHILDSIYVSPVNLVDEPTKSAEPASPVQPREPERDACFTPFEVTKFKELKTEIKQILAVNVNGILIKKLIEDLLKTSRSHVTDRALKLWPLGVLRMFEPDIRIVGSYVTLAIVNNYQHYAPPVAEFDPRGNMDPWEKMIPANVRYDVHLINYVESFMLQFGPQNTIVSIPIRILAHIIPSECPQSAITLCRRLTKLTSKFIIFDNTFLLTTHVHHRRFIMDKIDPIKRPRKAKISDMFIECKEIEEPDECDLIRLMLPTIKARIEEAEKTNEALAKARRKKC